jgi:hypothetical protein
MLTHTENPRGVVGFVDHREAAAAEFFEDLVFTDACRLSHKLCSH